MPPGLFETAVYDTTTITLDPGDAVLFCSDGITDAFSLADEAFGHHRVQEVCETTPFAEPAGLLAAIFSKLEEFTSGREQYDDMTAAVLGLNP